MRKEFQVHMLNEAGKINAKYIAEVFSNTLDGLATVCPDSREFSIVKTKMEEACFFAKKAMANDPKNID